MVSGNPQNFWSLLKLEINIVQKPRHLNAQILKKSLHGSATLSHFKVNSWYKGILRAGQKNLPTRN